MPISSVKFWNFKALSEFGVSLQRMNVLVGPNNCGKSTVLSAFRVLEQAMRTARSRRPTRVDTHRESWAPGHFIPDNRIPIPIENVHSDYSDVDSRIDFRFANGNFIYLFFPAEGGARIYWKTRTRTPTSAATFRSAFPVQVNVIPVLGPVERHERIVTVETVRRATGTPTASRHFRNFWKMNPEGFDEFRQLVEETWPGMSVGRPEIASYEERRLAMYASEYRKDRELYWSGLGFQVWCQLLTYISRYKDADLLIVDEPEVYLHPEVQRRLLGILREAKPDVLLATHSVEILGEAEPSEILLIDKTKRSAQRLRDVDGVQQALDIIGSIQNITLTELARNRRLLFVEGLNDYKIMRRFAKILGFSDLAAGIGLTALGSGGFSSWENIKGFSWGLTRALSSALKIAAVFDRDFRSDDEISSLKVDMEENDIFANFHSRKEIENYLLRRQPLCRTIRRLIRRRTGEEEPNVDSMLNDTLRQITSQLKADCSGQYVSSFCRFHEHSGQDQATLASRAIAVFDSKWERIETRLEIVPGKQVLKTLRSSLQDKYQISLTDYEIISSFRKEDVPNDLVALIQRLDEFRAGARQ